MAIFGSKKKKEEKKDVPKAKKEKSVVAPQEAKSAPVVAEIKQVLVRPRITEKAANLTSQNVYTFDITMRATKKDVANAVKKLYKVTPIKVNVVNVSARQVRLRRKRGFGKTIATRKAYVYLKKGDQIQFA